MSAYYRCFIKKNSYITTPLHDLPKKKNLIFMVKEENDFFETLKAKLISQPILILPDLSKPFQVQCDACKRSLGAMLL